MLREIFNFLSKPMYIHFQTLFPSSDFLKDLNYFEHHPIRGIQTAVLKLAQEFIKLGHQVTFGDAAQKEDAKGKKCDVFIAVRLPHLMHEAVERGRLNYLWCHDDIDQPAFEFFKDAQKRQALYEMCDGIILLSHYHMERVRQAFVLPLSKIFLSSNGISKHVVDEVSLQNRKPWVYYSSSPERGLNILVELWPLISQHVPNAHLFIAGTDQGAPEPEVQALLQQALTKCRGMNNVTLLGSVGQQKLREISAQCRVLAYPCIFPETSCITAMEAMASGCVVVSTALGALPETAWRNPLFAMDEQWFSEWAGEVVRVLRDDAYYTTIAWQNLGIAREMDWTYVAQRWLHRFVRDGSMKQISL